MTSHAPASLRSVSDIRPLDGVRVISLEHAIAAPFCSRQLADLGAEVIKIERPGTGDFARHYDSRARGLASHFVWANRGKQSLTLDVKTSEGHEVLLALLGDADVLIQNLSPGASARLGLSFEALHEQFPRLIVCDISGYGNDGPYARKKAYDLLIQSESGLVSQTGTRDTPVKAGVSISDIAAGMYAYSNILAALLKRARSGEGSHIDVSMLEATVEWMGYPLYYALDGAEPPPRAGASHSTIYPYGPFAAGDGQSVMLGLQNEREWGLFCEQVLKQPDLIDDPRFATNAERSRARQALDAVIDEAFSTLSAEEVVARLDQAGIANAHVNEMADVWAHPQLAARGRWCEVDSPVGPLQALLPPGQGPASNTVMGAIPALGEHTREILVSLGHDDATIAAWREKGVV